MNLNVKYIKKKLSLDDDFVYREMKVNTKDSVYVLFYESLTNGENIYKFIIKPIEVTLLKGKKIKNLESILLGPKLFKIENVNDIFYYLENGFVGVLYKKEIYVLEIKSEIDRGITMSLTEPNMYGPKDAFCENYQKNIGVVKKRIKNTKLKVESVIQGDYTKNKSSILYIDDKIDKNELEKIKAQLEKFNYKDVDNSYDVVSEFNKKHIFPIIFKTEKPSTASKFLLKGYTIIVMDNAPFALVIDARFKDFINPYTTDKFVRILRYVCLFLNVLAPALYIALVNFNPETIPTDLLISFSSQRMGVPFPLIVEATIMLFVCEILREADIRFPSTYGSSTSILGALVMGEAAVNAGFVSPIIIIVVAISFVTGLIFTETELVASLRILRFLFLLVASILGLYGLSISVVAVLALVSNVKLLEGEYL